MLAMSDSEAGPRLADPWSSPAETRRLRAALAHAKRQPPPLIATLAAEGMIERLQPIRLPSPSASGACVAPAWPELLVGERLPQRMEAWQTLILVPPRAPQLGPPAGWVARIGRMLRPETGGAPAAPCRQIEAHDQLPLHDASVDLLMANLVPCWVGSVRSCVAEWLRVLKPGGLLMLAALGPDSGREWADQGVVGPIDRSGLVDLHDWGDAMVEAGFGDPVLDVDRRRLRYRDLRAALDEWSASLPTRPRRPGLGRRAQTPSPSRLQAGEGAIELTVELTFGHAFKPSTVPARRSVDGVHIDVEDLRAQLRGRRTR
jgi:malonyl-CoA O-methyltransferase